MRKAMIAFSFQSHPALITAPVRYRRVNCRAERARNGGPMSIDLLTLFVVGIGALALGLCAAFVQASAKGSVLILTATLLTAAALGSPPEAWWLPAALAGAYGGMWVLRRPRVRRLGAW